LDWIEIPVRMVVSHQPRLFLVIQVFRIRI
jgi:hypothetical protein